MLTGRECSNSVEELRQRALDIRPPEAQVSRGMYNLIRKCCHPDPSKRPTMAQVLEECAKSKLAPLEEEANRQAILRPQLQ